MALEDLIGTRKHRLFDERERKRVMTLMVGGN
jgi:hypothetical protein